METNEYQQIVIKTEVEEAEDPHEESNYLSQARDSILGGTETNLINIKLEPGIKQEDQNEEFILASECKLEMKVEVNNEDCNSHTKFKPDVVDGSPNMTDEILDGSETKSVIHSNDSERYVKPFFCSRYSYIRVANNKGNVKKHSAKHVESNENSATKIKCEKHKFSAIRPFKCDKCNYPCKTEDALKKHLVVHTDLWPFQCDKCRYRAKREGSLKQHKKSVHTVYSCNKCSFKGKRKRHLDEHLLTHSSLNMNDKKKHKYLKAEPEMKYFTQAKPKSYHTNLPFIRKNTNEVKCTERIKIENNYKWRKPTHAGYQTDSRESFKRQQITYNKDFSGACAVNQIKCKIKIEVDI